MPKYKECPEHPYPDRGGKPSPGYKIDLAGIC